MAGKGGKGLGKNWEPESEEEEEEICRCEECEPAEFPFPSEEEEGEFIEAHPYAYMMGLIEALWKYIPPAKARFKELVKEFLKTCTYKPTGWGYEAEHAIELVYAALQEKVPGTVSSGPMYPTTPEARKTVEPIVEAMENGLRSLTFLIDDIQHFRTIFFHMDAEEYIDREEMKPFFDRVWEWAAEVDEEVDKEKKAEEEKKKEEEEKENGKRPYEVIVIEDDDEEEEEEEEGQKSPAKKGKYISPPSSPTYCPTDPPTNPIVPFPFPFPRRSCGCVGDCPPSPTYSPTTPPPQREFPPASPDVYAL